MPETRWLTANLRFCVFDNKRTNREVRMNFKLLKQASQKTFLGAIGAAALSIVAIGTAQADPVTVVSWGGSYGKAQDAALFTDASKNSGIEIARESGASSARLTIFFSIPGKNRGEHIRPNTIVSIGVWQKVRHINNVKINFFKRTFCRRRRTAA